MSLCPSHSWICRLEDAADERLYRPRAVTENINRTIITAYNEFNLKTIEMHGITVYNIDAGDKNIHKECNHVIRGGIYSSVEE